MEHSVKFNSAKSKRRVYMQKDISTAALLFIHFQFSFFFLSSFFVLMPYLAQDVKAEVWHVEDHCEVTGKPSACACGMVETCWCVSVRPIKLSLPRASEASVS